MFEALESRRLMTTTLEDGTLTIRGTEADDNVMVWQPTGAVMRVEHNGEISEFATEEVASIFVSVGDGDDQVILGKRSVNAKISGGGGDDTLSAGDGNDTIYGDAGDDYLFGRDGLDKLDGGNGAGKDADDIMGGDGTDTVDYSARTKAVRIGLGHNFNDGEGSERDNVREDIEIALGGSGNDHLHNFNATPARLYGNGGNDLVVGGKGADLLAGGAGRDVLNGAGGFDSYFAKDGEKDVIVGGTGFGEMQTDAIDEMTDEMGDD